MKSTKYIQNIVSTLIFLNDLWTAHEVIGIDK